MVAALFDLDGVVVDTESQYSIFWNEIGKEFFPDRNNFADEIKGQTLISIVSRYFVGDDIQNEIKSRLRLFEMQMQFPYIPGVINYVKALHRRNVPLAVVTSSDRAKMKYLYAACPDFKYLFTHVFTSENATKSKPAPDCYLNAADALKVDIRKCVVFEDSLNGLKAGRNAGAKVVGLSTTLPAEVIAPFCDFHIPDFTYINTIENNL